MTTNGLADNHNLLPSFRAMDRPEKETPTPSVPDDATLEAEGAVVGRVIIDAQNIFDTEREDENTLLFRVANLLHIQTREDTIRDRLLFSSGEVYSARLLQESERLLRDTRYLYDARIRPVAYQDGKVDVEVVTRDTWTLNPGLNFGRSGGSNSFGLKLEERNLFGYGTRLQLEYTSNIDRDVNKISYRDTNLGSSWWDLDLTAQDNSDGEAQFITVQRPFYELDARWSASVSYSHNDRVESIFDRGEAVDRYRVRSEVLHISRGWSKGLREGRAHRWFLGYSYSDTRFNPVLTTVDTSLVPDNTLRRYPWVGYEYVEDGFYEARNRDQIARTEDFTQGWAFTAEAGLSQQRWGSDIDALLINGSLAKGHQFSVDDTLQFSTGLEGTVIEDELVDGLSSVLLRYYHRQSPRRLFYASLGSDSGIELDPNVQLLLGGDNGLRGYPLRYVSGQGRWLLTLEQRFFSTWYPFRLFHVGGAIFFDAGGVWGHSLNSVENPGVLRDVGFGFRLGNSRSALGNVLHLDFAFPLDGDSSIDDFQFLVETKSSF